MTDTKANIFEVQYLYGSHGSRHGGHKREGRCALPGEICQSAIEATVVERLREGLAEVSSGHSRHIDRAEGPDVKK